MNHLPPSDLQSAADHAQTAHLWPDETVAAHRVTRVITAPPESTCGALRARLARGLSVESTELIFLIDAQGHLLGLVPMARALEAPTESRLAAHALTPAPAVRAEADPEQAANLAIAQGLSGLPIVDDRGRLLGAIPATALLGVLRREHVEDLQRLAGLNAESARAREAVDAPPLRRARDRLPWLLIGLAGSALATGLMAQFEATLQSNVVIAFFIPAIVYLADAVGTQSEAVAVRELSLSRRPLRKIIGSEARTGLIIGLALSGLALAAVWIWHQDAVLALAVALSLFAASMTASLSGFALPWLIARGGQDPAYGSGPLATIVQDLLSLAIYLGTVTLLIGA